LTQDTGITFVAIKLIYNWVEMIKLREDYKCYREGLLAQGFWALLFYRFGALRFRFKSKLVRFPIAIIYILLSKFSQVFFGIYIGAHAKIGRRLTIEHFGCIVLHNRVVIGDDVIIRQGVTIGNKTLDAPNAAPIIGNRVSIGAGAKILGGITIGDDVLIGANAVVIRDVPSNSIAVGVPAIVKSRK
jgi:serine O-acetyltransferase